VAAWLLLLAALGVAFTAQGRVSAAVGQPVSASSAGAEIVEAGRGGIVALWLLVAGLACAAIAILF
jgi:hypothetical protein